MVQKRKFKEGDCIRSLSGLYNDYVIKVLPDEGYLLEKFGPLPLDETQWRLMTDEEKKKYFPALVKEKIVSNIENHLNSAKNMKNLVVYNASYGGFCLSDDAERWLMKHGMDEKTIQQNKFNRHDPLLIQCVRELGDNVNGLFADIKVGEIEGDTYIINNYDGMENVITPEQIEWIKIEEETES